MRPTAGGALSPPPGLSVCHRLSPESRHAGTHVVPCGHDGATVARRQLLSTIPTKCSKQANKGGATCVSNTVKVGMRLLPLIFALWFS